MVEQFCQQAAPLLAGIEEEPTWEVVLAMEPGARPFLSETQFDAACMAIADFADMKSPYTPGHSRGVAELAAEAARRCGLPEADAVTIRRAGLLHDLGRTGVPTSIWGKPGPLSEREWERVRMHPYYAERVLAAAGHRVRPTRRALVAGLSEREVEVLRLLARGHSKKQIAERLVISQKTVDQHTQHIYNKIAVSTRAAATLFAIEHDLIAPLE
jgi:DNA-binding CsgD family transcriptional regulator